MNVLIDELPDAVEIDGVTYHIETDFRACLRAIIAFEDDDLTPLEKQLVMLANLYPEQPHDLQGALEQAIRFLDGGHGQADSENRPGYRLYSFAKDSSLIYAAFRQTHGIDLEAVELLHWWKFLALFMDLGAETAFCQLVALRKRVKSGRASKWERQAALEMGEAFLVPEPATPEQVEAKTEFMRLLEEGERRREKSAQDQIQPGDHAGAAGPAGDPAPGRADDARNEGVVYRAPGPAGNLRALRQRTEG
jgi:hypothetical protein